jgi:tRNA nucleotidyltransferase (CCA-adding enzyme)
MCTVVAWPLVDRAVTYNGPVKAITTHLSADFDAFAAAVCAVRLYPDHQVLFPGSQEVAVRRFMEDTKFPFPELKLRQARREAFEHVVVTDTRNPARLGEVWQLIERDRCPITVIDHHVTEPDLLGAGEVISRPVGATCTIVAQLMRERELPPSSEEASLLLMGIYEDTGGLSYRETTPTDLRIVAWLLEQGGSLDWVRRWVMKALQPDQLELLNRIVEGCEEILVRDTPVELSMVEVDRYHEEAAYVVHRWVETFEIPVGVVMLVRPPHINLIIRSRISGLHAGRVAQRFGGGGHPTAASARVSGRMPVEVREELLRVLDEEMPPPSAAIDIAARRIFTIDLDATVAETKRRINQLRVNALPVNDPAAGRLVGMVTRQILDRALTHGMAERPVQSVMQPDLPVVAARTPLAELRDLFLERSYRFVVVEDEGRPAGIVTRMELFRRMFERQHTTGAALDHRIAGVRPISQPLARLLREHAPPWVQELMAAARQVADEQGSPAFLVGGMVRDLLLGRPSEDVDLVVEGDGILFAEALAAALGGRSHPHAPFLTAIVTLPDGHRVDVASARTEFYRTPAALPEVETSLIRQDLYRRDFTINALAVALAGDRHGELVDFFGGRKDIQRREIRVLHSLSFIDDPTRAIRAVRYARRLGFAVAPDTRNLIATAVRERVFERLSGQRLRRELEHLLEESHPTPSLSLLADLGLLPVLIPDLKWSEELRSFLLEVEGQLAWHQLERLGPPPASWFLFLGALVVRAPAGAELRLCDRLQLAGDVRRRMMALPGGAEAVRAAARSASLAPSQLLHRVEGQPPEVLLLAMADVDLAARQRLADAVETAVRLAPPVSGAELLAAGIPPGPHIGLAIRRARDAVVDGVIRADGALEHALSDARRGAEEKAKRCAPRPGSARPCWAPSACSARARARGWPARTRPRSR